MTARIRTPAAADRRRRAQTAAVMMREMKKQSLMRFIIGFSGCRTWRAAYKSTVSDQPGQCAHEQDCCQHVSRSANKLLSTLCSINFTGSFQCCRLTALLLWYQWKPHKTVVHCINKKLSYRQRTARCVMSVEILPVATQQSRNYLYDKSWTNRSYEVGWLRWADV